MTANSKPLDLAQIAKPMPDTMWRDQERIESLAALAREQQQTIAMLLKATQIAYTILGDVRHQWRGRHTTEGQGALCAMRDAIAYATGRSPKDVQDESALAQTEDK